MRQLKLGYIGKSFAMGGLGVIGTIIAACGGGGETATAAAGTVSKYVLFASSYTFNTNVAATDPAKWTSLEGGTASMGAKDGGNFIYGDYGIFDNAAINYNQGVGIQFRHAAALNATDFLYLQVKSPANTALDVSLSSNLVIQMGNGVNVNDNANTARVFTVFVEGGDYNATAYTYAYSCQKDVTIPATNFQPNGNPLGMSTYKIALADFTCTGGSTSAAALTSLEFAKGALTKAAAAHADAAAGRRVQSVLDGIYRSSAEGREVEI